MPETRRLDRFWRANLRLIGGLLGVWLVVAFGLPFLARELSFGFFGWPFAFWVASQGALFVFVGIVVVYNRRMDRLAQALDVDRD